MSSEVEAVRREGERDREVVVSSAVTAARQQWLAAQEDAIKVSITSL